MKLFPKNLLMIVTAAVLLAPTAFADGFNGRGGQGGPGQGGGFQGGGQQGGGRGDGRGDDRGGRGDGRGDNRGGGRGDGRGDDRGGRGGDWGRGGPGRGGPGHGGPGRGGPGPGFPQPPVQRQVIVNCGSGNYGFNRCFVAGNVSNIQLARQESQAGCIFGRTFGFEGNSIWVDKGCRADFAVYLY